MPAYPVPEDEAERQRVLDDFHVLDSPSDDQLDRLTRLASQMLGLPIALISLVDRDRQWFLSKVGLDVPQTARDVAFCAHAICGQGVMVVPDARLDVRFRDNPLVQGAPHIRFYAGAPLQSQDGHTLGTLCVIGHEPRPMTGRESQLLQDLADLVMQDLEARRRSWRCPLTGVLNRRPFFEEGERDTARAIELQARLSVLVLDLDAFGDVNDRFGRAFGDAVLRRVAAMLREECRPTDLLGRVANDDFALTMPDTDLAEARAIAERLSGKIGATVFALEGVAVPLTVSAAVAQLHHQDRSFADLFRRAEYSLQLARHRSGHFIVTALPPDPAGPDGRDAAPG
jgi:diguanylate cyclase (GGDEF)-like protein